MLDGCVAYLNLAPLVHVELNLCISVGIWLDGEPLSTASGECSAVGHELVHCRSLSKKLMLSLGEPKCGASMW